MSARELRAAGQSVVVLDQGEVGRESSWAGGGIISPLYPWRYPSEVVALSAWSQVAYPQLAEVLQRESGVDIELITSGMLVIDPNDAEKAIKFTENAGIACEVLDRSGILRLAGIDAKTGIWLPSIAQVRNPHLITALKSSLIRSGVKIRENAKVEQILSRHGKLTGLKVSGEEIPASQCLVAAGAWTGGLLKSLNIDVSVHPVRGQMLLFKAPHAPFQPILLKDYHYLIPRLDGHVLAGSTFEDVGFDRSVTDTAREELYCAAVQLVPALRDTPVVRHWSGLRPGSPDGVPYIGAWPDIEGLYVSAGHFRNGIALAPASARLIADLILGRSPIISPDPYSPTRNRA